MRSLAKCVVPFWLYFICSVLYAAGQLEKGSEPTVGIGWVVMFVVVFVGICVFIGVAAVRAERKNKNEPPEQVQGPAKSAK